MLAGGLKIEIIIAIVAIVFFINGIYLNKRGPYQERLPEGELDLNKLKALDLSNREYEVFKEISFALSNKEIGEKLFISESTIKTYASNSGETKRQKAYPSRTDCQRDANL